MDVMDIADLANETVELPEHLTQTTSDVRRRVRALKKLQLESIKIQAEFYAKVHELEAEFSKVTAELGAKRAAVVNGQHEPTAEESSAPLLHVLEKEELSELEREWDNNNPSNGETGIPDFWLNVFKGSSSFADMIQEHDEPVLKHLVDLTYSVEVQPQAFTLTFKFAPNNGFFTNTEITKRYETSTAVDEKEPFEYQGPYWVSIEGTQIDWLPGKDVTKDKDGETQESVFNFFKVTGKRDDSLPETALAELEIDYDIAQTIRDEIITRAVLYYTGEAIDGESDYDDFDDEEDSDDDCEDGCCGTIEEMDE
uniref:Nucleosome assembly protein 1-like 1 n=1 Tax=Steinernema glaseri TaxID=37863 RepID=A0A1I8AKY3_9BILA